MYHCLVVIVVVVAVVASVGMFNGCYDHQLLMVILVMMAEDVVVVVRAIDTCVSQVSTCNNQLLSLHYSLPGSSITKLKKLQLVPHAGVFILIDRQS